MASNGEETFGDLIGGTAAITSEHNDQSATLQPQASVTRTSALSSTTQPRSAAYRGVRFAAATDGDLDEEEDSWWWEVENENLTLDQVPNVTAVFTPSPEDIIHKPHCLEETQAVVPDENFDRLHRIADRIKNTIHEQRERHLSESSDKSLNDYAKLELDADKSSALESPKEQSLEEFKEELKTKREARQTAVQNLRDEIVNLRKQLEREREVSRRLRNGENVDETTIVLNETLTTEASAKLNNSTSAEIDLQGACALAKTSSLTSNSDEDDEDPLSRSRHANIELANAQLALQMANAENISLRGELAGVQKQVGTLKEVVACCKQMLSVKEEQCNELKDRLTEIEKSFAEHEMKIMSENLRQEYERQLVNMRQLRQLYEERQRVAAAEYENLERLISIKCDELAQEKEKTKNLEERNDNLVKEVEAANNELACLRDECKEHKFEKSSLKEEIGAVNTLFSQMVMGFNGKNNLDIDRLTTMLEENRTLLNDMATKECTDGATLPKLLFELVEQASVDNDKKSPSCSSTTPKQDMPLELENNGDDDNDDDDDVETTTSQTEDDDDVVENTDNENVASVANDNETPATATPIQPLAEQQQHQEPRDVSASTDVVDATAIVGGSAPSVASDINEKVIVAALPAKSKKLHHHHHHRKASSSKKSTTLSSSSAAAATASTATLQFNDPEVIGKVTSAQEIIGNLPKVWRVLMELLSHHQIDPVQFEENGKGEDCYKSVETPNGPKAELSVSKTYLKLKDLILEKKSLVKETNRLKTLNCHLDYRLNEQEKRLSAVSLELTKTWHLVGKMQRQHRQLHTQEQILRYQLQQKRRLLHELKDELEYCRRKWQAARAKNDESQEQCNDLRREFARRKLEDANNSAESGYSDSGGQVSDEEAMANVNASGAVGVDPPKLDVAVDDDDKLCEASSMAASAAGGCVNYRRKRLREMFEHTRKIKRMQSTSPSRANDGKGDESEVVILRWNSAPPTCGWRDTGGSGDDNDSMEEDEVAAVRGPSPSSSSTADTGAIPKSSTRSSRRPKRSSVDRTDAADIDQSEAVATETSDGRAARILRLEEQCKTLIQQVLETSDNRERLEVQLKRFQDEMSPVQYAVPLDELINKKRLDRMTRASSAPASGSLTPREEEYTRKRSERLGRLEEESRQLIFRIKRTSDRGHYLRCSLDRIRRAPPSREGSFESNTEEETRKPEEESACVTNNEASPLSSASSTKEDSPSTSSSAKSPLTAEEEAYTARRAARLQRLEEESKQLLNKLSHNNQRGDSLGSRLDTLHERHGSAEGPSAAAAAGGSNNDCTTSTGSGTSGQLTTEQRIENIEKISSNREQRLRILEEEGRQLINRLSETSEKGTQMINRIAERELSRQNRSTSTPQRETVEASSSSKTTPTTPSIQKTISVDSNGEEVPEASALLPPLKNVACSSIVSEELTDRVTITTIPSRIAAHQGAIPKSKPTSQLLAARPKSARLQSTSNSTKTQDANESLEDMVRRLQSLPFPNKDDESEEKKNEDSELPATEDNSLAAKPNETLESEQVANVATKEAQGSCDDNDVAKSD